MLPTPDTSHVPYERVYEPSEDSFLLLDTLSSESEQLFLQQRVFSNNDCPPLIVEVGTGSGVVLAFVHAQAATLFGGDGHFLTAGVDVSAQACRATVSTVTKADRSGSAAVFLGCCVGDLATPWKERGVDVLICNPPYVPTPEMPVRPMDWDEEGAPRSREMTFEDEAYLLALSYAGGKDGMEMTDRLIAELPSILSPRGCAYLLLCTQNKPEELRTRIHCFGETWRTERVGCSGKTAGWEKLHVLRIWRDDAT